MNTLDKPCTKDTAHMPHMWCRVGTPIRICPGVPSRAAGAPTPERNTQP